MRARKSHRKPLRGYKAISPRKINWKKAQRNWVKGSIKSARKWKKAVGETSSTDYIEGIRGSSGRWAEKFRKVLMK